MAPAIRRQCQCPGCSFGEDGQPYKTQHGLVTQDSVLKDLELHLMMVHANATEGASEVVSEAPSEVKTDTVPQMTLSTLTQLT